MSSVYFNGEMIAIPGAYSMVDASSMGTKGDSTTSRVIALIGEADGGEPETVQLFSNPVAAKKVLKGGDLLVACNKAWNPVTKTKQGVALGGANLIACIRTNRATKSSLTIEEGKIVFESADWNADANQLAVRISNGTNDGTKRLTIYNQAAEVYENIDNIGGLFSVAYTGDQPYAEMTIGKSEAGEFYFQTKVGADADSAQQDIYVVLGALEKEVIKSMKALIEILRAYENYSVVPSSHYNSSTKVTKIDPVSKVNIKTAYNVTSFYYDLQAKVAVNSNFITVKSVDNTKGAVENFDYKFLTGGSDGTTKASWVEYFDMLSNYDITYIVPLVGDQSIHAELLAHVQTMSGTKGKERRMIVGGDTQEVITNTILRARALQSDRVQVVHGGFYDYATDGTLVLYPPYILAAQHAGRAAYLEDGESATHDTYNVAAPEYTLETNEIEQLLEAGILAFELVVGASTSSSAGSSTVRLVHDLTTAVGESATVYTERAVGVLADSINKEIRTKLDAILTGKRTTASDLVTARTAVTSILYKRKNSLNQIIDYKDVYITKDGTTTTIDYSIAPAEPNNFTLITAHYYSESIQI